MQSKKRGPKKTWGNNCESIIRPRLPIEIVTEIDIIRQSFEDPDDALQYVLDALKNESEFRELKLYYAKASATPGVTSMGEFCGFQMRSIPSLFLKSRKESFLLQVSGDSMEGVGIRDGNFILVEVSSNDLPDGSIVAAIIDDQLVVKRLRRRKGYDEFVSENKRKNYPPIRIEQTMSDHLVVKLLGIYKRVIPKQFIFPSNEIIDDEVN